MSSHIESAKTAWVCVNFRVWQCTYPDTERERVLLTALSI